MALIRISKKCEVFLLKFKEEICLNPYTDVTPYTQMLAAEFRKWNKEGEKDVINKLFLNLYSHDAKSLRRDLCKLEPQEVLSKFEAPDEAKNKFPQRALLVGFLYHIVSWYTGGYSWLIDLCGRVMDAEQIKYENLREKYIIEHKIYEIEQILVDFQEEVGRNSDIDVTIWADELADVYDRVEIPCRYRIIKTLYLRLYAQDAEGLKSALNKISWKMFNPAAVTPEQRTELLQYLYVVLSSYIGEDFSLLIELENVAGVVPMCSR